MTVRVYIRLFLACLLSVVWLQASAQEHFSYVYIQGDKETPFYVKLDGQMIPRYGKNYCILSELSGGPIHIEILFQQRVYPSQKFTINVPENGCRGLLLSKRGDHFELYDLQQKKYLPLNGEQ